MILELIFTAYLVEGCRAWYWCRKEMKRKEIIYGYLSESLRNSKTWDQLAINLQKSKEDHPEDFVKIPQTWLYKVFGKE
ncbi:MAG: hypothetical protein K0Q73_6750 [Paenibacillus sp.]|jgi:hypothetical protein|nr:hypothetical protein [Paenibacillus sp.]